MKDFQIAIGERPKSFSDRWIEYCQANGILVNIVQPTSNDIISKISHSSAFLWHPHQTSHADMMLSRTLAEVAQAKGIPVYPNRATIWHFDDKIGQKYWLEASGAPFVKTYVFFSLTEALDWVKSVKFPKVYKLRRGAGSMNVKLVHNKIEAIRLAEHAFKHGNKPISDITSDGRTKMRKKKNFSEVLGAIRRLPQTMASIQKANRYLGLDIGYIYFQDYIPNNLFDTRITVIGERAFGFTRNVRPGDFRASGSGSICYDVSKIDERTVEIAFDVAGRLASQSMAFDFVQTNRGEPLIIEMSYAFMPEAVYSCPGHWRKGMCWVPGKVHPEDAIIEDLLHHMRCKTTVSRHAPMQQTEITL